MWARQFTSWGWLLVIDVVWGCGGLVSVGNVGTCRVIVVVILVVVDEVDVRWGYGEGGAHKRGRMQAGVGIDCKRVR
jgi:hypothetical protein